MKSIKYELIIPSYIFQKTQKYQRLRNLLKKFYPCYNLNFNTSNSTPVIAGRWGITGAATFPQKIIKIRSVFSLRKQLKKASHL